MLTKAAKKMIWLKKKKKKNPLTLWVLCLSFATCFINGILTTLLMSCSCLCRPFDQPHGDGNRDCCSHCVHTLHSAQCSFPYVPVTEAGLERSTHNLEHQHTHTPAVMYAFFNWSGVDIYTLFKLIWYAYTVCFETTIMNLLPNNRIMWGAHFRILLWITSAEKSQFL